MKRIVPLVLVAVPLIACAGGGPQPSPAAPPAAEAVPEGVDVPEGGRVADGVIYDAKGEIWGCVSGGNDCAGPPVGMMDAPAEIVPQTPIPWAVESANDWLTLPWRQNIDNYGELPAIAGGGVQDPEVKGFYVAPDAPVSVEVVGRYTIVDGVDAFVYHAQAPGQGEHVWAIRYWNGRDDFATFAIGGSSDAAGGVRTVRSPVIDSPTHLTVFETVVRRKDNGDLIDKKDTSIQYEYRNAAFVEVGRQDITVHGPP